MCAILLEHLMVGRVVICEGQQGQGLPEAFGQSQILGGRVLKLGQLHFILQDYKSVGLDNRCGRKNLSKMLTEPTDLSLGTVC